MDVNDVRQLIREEIEAALDERDARRKLPPTTYGDMRSRFGEALYVAGADDDLVKLVTASDESSIIECLDRAWSDLESARVQVGQAWSEASMFAVATALDELTRSIDETRRRRVKNSAFTYVTLRPTLCC